jgi:hypothetical protein
MDATLYRVLLICLPIFFFITVGVFIYRFIKQQRAASVTAPDDDFKISVLELDQV